MARGTDEREETLGWLAGVPTSPAVVDALESAALGDEPAAVRAAAMGALVVHVGGGAADVVRSCFGSRSFELRLRALRQAVRLDVDLGEAFVPWARRRLGGRGRLSVWDYSEPPTVLCYASRRHLLPRLLGAVERLALHLDPVEVPLLEAAWPATSRRRFGETSAAADGPDDEALVRWLERAEEGMHRPAFTPERAAALETVLTEQLAGLVAGLRRRQARSGAAPRPGAG
ncbi:hypothetical protein [Nocardioides marinquilinus]|uniref:hypothetical protein n=1 Tax=Nocardioides marinquilinus TaxID=1210400 RepID=UPI0031EFD483